MWPRRKRACTGDRPGERTLPLPPWMVRPSPPTPVACPPNVSPRWFCSIPLSTGDTLLPEGLDTSAYRQHCPLVFLSSTQDHNLNYLIFSLLTNHKQTCILPVDDWRVFGLLLPSSAAAMFLITAVGIKDGFLPVYQLVQTDIYCRAASTSFK